MSQGERQQALCVRLADALIWVHSPQGGAGIPACDAQTGMSVSPFSAQWLNGLVHELFFPGEFEPPDLARVIEDVDNAAEAKAPEEAEE